MIEITSQTSLPTLNANIEAARAGEIEITIQFMGETGLKEYNGLLLMRKNIMMKLKVFII